MNMAHNELFDKIAASLNTTFVNQGSIADDILTENMEKACELKAVDEPVTTTLDTFVQTSQDRVLTEVQPKPTQSIMQSYNRGETAVSTVKTQMDEELIENKMFIQNELYTSISQVGEVMTMMKEGLKQGARASEFEAFARLNDSLVNTIDKLATLNMKLADKKSFMSPDANPQVGNQTLIFNGADMLDKLLELRKSQKG